MSVKAPSEENEREQALMMPVNASKGDSGNGGVSCEIEQEKKKKKRGWTNLPTHNQKRTIVTKGTPGRSG